MLTLDQQRYLDSLPIDKFVRIQPYNPKCALVAEKIISTVHSHYPKMEARFSGAAALKIAGVNDVDLDFMVLPEYFHEYLATFTTLFGQPRDVSADSAVWTFYEGEIEVDMWLSNPLTESNQWAIHTLIADSPELTKQYEDLKLSCDGMSYQEYVRAKYEFFDDLSSEILLPGH